MRTVVAVAAAVVAAAVADDAVVGLVVDYVAVVDDVEAADVTVVVVGARQLPQSDEGVAVVVGDGLAAGAGAVAAAGARRLDRSADVPGVGPVT